VSHIRENGRITILFHAFEGPARIVRLYGKGFRECLWPKFAVTHVYFNEGFCYQLGTPEYDALLSSDRRLPGSRAVIGLDVYKVGTVS